MPDLSDDKQLAAAYPPTPLYDSWVSHSESLDLSVSRFIIQMVEAGRMQLNMDEFAADTLRELRDQRDDLRNEVERQRTRNEELESQIARTARADIVGFVEENPGATAPEIIQHVANSVPSRTVAILDMLDGHLLCEREGLFYITEKMSPSDGRDEQVDSAYDS